MEFSKGTRGKGQIYGLQRPVDTNNQAPSHVRHLSTLKMDNPISWNFDRFWFSLVNTGLSVILVVGC